MGTTQIPYADRSWNVTVGCTHSGLKGCDNCWAKELHDMRHKAWLEGKKVPKQYSKPFCEIVLRPDRLDEPLHIRKPMRFFVCSMSDLFHPLVPFDYIDKVMAVIALCPQHTFMILTKRIKRMSEYFGKICLSKRAENISKKMQIIKSNPFFYYQDYCIKNKEGLILPNLWLIVSRSTQKELDENIPILFQIPAAVRGVSLEPLLGEIDLWHGIPDWEKCCGCGKIKEMPKVGHITCDCLESYRHNQCEVFPLFYLDWVIVGAESGKNRRPCKTEWVRKIVKDYQAAGVATYVKQLDIDGRLITDPAKFPTDLRIRDFPE